MGDYGTKTTGLSLAERGAYDSLLDEYYTKERPLPKDKRELYRIVRAFERWERAAVDSVLAKFFSLTDAGYSNPRAEEELAKYKKAADIHRANGSRHTSNLLPSRNLKPVEIPDTRNQIKEKPKNKSSAQTAPFVLPDWIPVEEWNGFVEMRQRMRSPLTSRAKYLCISKLASLLQQAQRPEAVLNQSVENGWKGLFPLNGKSVRDEAIRTEARVGAGPALPSHPMCESPTCKMCAARRRSRERDLLPVGAGPQGRMG